MKAESKEGAVPRSPWMKFVWFAVVVLVCLAMLAELLVALL